MTSGVEVRQLAADEDEQVVTLFLQTMLLGHDATRSFRLVDEYAEVCLGWYLRDGRQHTVVAVRDGQVVGYALACTDSSAQAKWARRRSVRLSCRVLGLLLTFRLDRASRRFYAARARDAGALWRSGQRPPQPIQVHLNVAAHSRSGTTALALRDHLDGVAADLGASGWYGEINAERGHRAKALGRLGLSVVSRTPNKTLTAILGRPVDRLTVVRNLDRKPSSQSRASTPSGRQPAQPSTT